MNRLFRYLASMFAMAALPASADQPAYVGYWAAEPAHCTNQPQSDNGPEIIDANAVYGWEFSCELTRVQPTGFGRSWRVSMECLDAGFKENWEEMWFVTVDDRLLRIDESGYHSESVRCPDPDARAACEADGGRFEAAGLSQQPVCIRPSPDAGKACANAGDCTGLCLAETRTCSPVSPMFGCHKILMEDGDQAEICLD